METAGRGKREILKRGQVSSGVMEKEPVRKARQKDRSAYFMRLFLSKLYRPALPEREIPGYPISLMGSFVFNLQKVADLPHQFRTGTFYLSGL